MIQKYRAKYSILEGYEDPTVTQLHDNNLISPSISNASKTTQNLPLKELCIKASYNSAYNGYDIINTTNTNGSYHDMIEYVLSRGCRFLDFELYYDSNSSSGSDIDKVVVNYTADPTFTTFTNANPNKVTFNSVMTYITSNYSSGVFIPNSSDPLFIHLRIKSDNTAIYGIIAKILDDSTNVLFTDQINGDTKLSDLYDNGNGKIVILMDRSIRPDDDIKSTSNNSNSLPTYISAFTGMSSWEIDTYSEIKNQKTTPPKITNNDTNKTNVTNLRIALPDIDPNSANPTSPFNFIEKNGIQTIACRFYKHDIFLDLYEDLFAEHQSAFVPLAKAIKYIKRKKEDMGSRKMKLGPNIVHG
jgi:hypothetical protein